MEGFAMERAPDPECLFCKIVQGQIPVEVVGETDDLLAFRDINPQAPHHVLVIPKQHIPTVNDLEDAEAALVGRMAILARDLARDQGCDVAGYRLVLNCNRHGGQTVFHLHMHLLAGRSMSWPPG
jgi:histidine triad (HIT) family protein